MFSALRSFHSAKQIQRALISFQILNLFTSSFSFSVQSLLSEMANKPLVSISAGTSGYCSPCPPNRKTLEDTGRHPPISRSKCTRERLQTKRRLPTTTFSYKSDRTPGNSKQLTFAWYIYWPKFQEYFILLFKMFLLYNKLHYQKSDTLLHILSLNLMVILLFTAIGANDRI